MEIWFQFSKKIAPESGWGVQKFRAYVNQGHSDPIYLIMIFLLRFGAVRVGRSKLLTNNKFTFQRFYVDIPSNSSPVLWATGLSSVLSSSAA